MRFWYKRFELLYKQKGPTKILCDNNFVICVDKGSNVSLRVKFHCIRDSVKNKKIKLEFYESKDQVIATKDECAKKIED